MIMRNVQFQLLQQQLLAQTGVGPLAAAAAAAAAANPTQGTLANNSNSVSNKISINFVYLYDKYLSNIQKLLKCLITKITDFFPEKYSNM
ncbi:unnamed protein product [Schistosoma curassoni]|uniref:Uncharacterized protein n=1 Tax=Schistosoma curassoni TaxID=6186 RepID=A0A183KXK5_9TREM|nr:unnamed protein product [Schistosoma curassoni]